jgi:hypothetical protein
MCGYRTIEAPPHQTRTAPKRGLSEVALGRLLQLMRSLKALAACQQFVDEVQRFVRSGLAQPEQCLLICAET